jgi:hypothetical protein
MNLVAARNKISNGQQAIAMIGVTDNTVSTQQPWLHLTIFFCTNSNNAFLGMLWLRT